MNTGEISVGTAAALVWLAPIFFTNLQAAMSPTNCLSSATKLPRISSMVFDLEDGPMVRHSASSSGRAMQLFIAPHSSGSSRLSSNTPPVYLGTCVQLEEDGKRAAQSCYDEHAEQVAELKLFLQATLSTQKVCATARVCTLTFFVQPRARMLQRVTRNNMHLRPCRLPVRWQKP